MFEFFVKLFKYLYPFYCFCCYYKICGNFIDSVSDFSRDKLAVFLSISFMLYYYQKIVKKILKLLLGCTLDEEKSISDVLFLMLGFCITKNSNFIFDIYLPSKIISFSGSILTSLEELIDGFSVKIVLPPISTHVILMLFLFLFFGVHFYFFCYFLINYNKNVEINSLIFSNLFTILFYTSCAMIYHTLFIFDRENFGCSIQTESKANTIRNYGGLIHHIFDFIIHLFRIYIIGPNFYTAFHIFLSFGKLYSSYDDFTFYLKMKNIKSELPDATLEDIERDDICIICRESMSVGTAKKLPCGHCFHTTCLERWVNKNPACPTCSRDLRKILKGLINGQNEQKNENQEQNENNNADANNNNNNENDNDKNIENINADIDEYNEIYYEKYDRNGNKYEDENNDENDLKNEDNNDNDSKHDENANENNNYDDPNVTVVSPDV